MFTDNLKKLRLEFGMTQKELAEELGTSQQSYMKWETGKTSPTLKSVEKIAQFFDVPISSLVNDNSLNIEDVLNAEYLSLNNIPLSESDSDDFKIIIDQYIQVRLKSYLNAQSTKGILLKNGRTASNDKKFHSK
ncbi:helix-turn-helix transcriptional regulator [Streptococcus gallolyticus]|nr:helix-turn-helix transcriptional regulator [Streptococcus gallolyticus]MBY5040700.1 helix-turn-helix transcriptional regulator [Streptococcus gallolyticus]